MRSTILSSAMSKAAYLSCGAGLGAHDRSGADQREFHTIIARAAVRLVMTDELDLEREGLLGELGDLVGLLGGVILEPIRNPHSATGDRDVHGTPSPSVRRRRVPGEAVSDAFWATVVPATGEVTER